LFLSRVVPLLCNRQLIADCVGSDDKRLVFYDSHRAPADRSDARRGAPVVVVAFIALLEPRAMTATRAGLRGLDDGLLAAESRIRSLSVPRCF
jgi:hypothetical protein